MAMCDERAEFVATLQRTALYGASIALMVKPGTHTLRAVATDALGNADATPAKATVKVIKKRKKKKRN